MARSRMCSLFINSQTVPATAATSGAAGGIGMEGSSSGEM